MTDPPPLSLNATGAAVAEVHASLTQLGYTIPAQEAAQQTFGPGTVSAVKSFQQAGGLPATGIIDPATQGALATATGPGSPGEGAAVAGRILVDDGTPAVGVAVRLYSQAFGGVATMLAEGRTDSNGSYSLAYTTPGTPFTLDVRALDPAGTEIVLVTGIVSTAGSQTVNLVAPAAIQPRQPEFSRLSSALTAQLGNIAAVAQAREGDGRSDLSLLHASTGWDARLLGLVATATNLATQTAMSPPAVYGLLRLGLPGDAQLLAQTSPDDVTSALQRAQDAGVVSLSAEETIAAQAAFAQFARTTLLARTAPGGVSSSNDFLTSIQMSESEKTAFTSVLMSNGASDEGLWQRAQQGGVSQSTIDALKLQGKVAYLTLNNAPLTSALQQKVGSADNLGALVDQESLHEPAGWTTLLSNLAGNDDAALQRLIPPGYTGSTTADRLDAYATDLARKVRISFPTRVVSSLLDQGELPLAADGSDLRTPVAAFLRSAEPLGFAPGRTAVNAFVRANQAALGSTASAGATGAVSGVKRLLRLYQITPSNASLTTALQLGFTSARDVTALGYTDFMMRFADRFPSRGEADLFYRKAQQVSAVAYNVFTGARTLGSSPPLSVTSPGAPAQQQARDAIVQRFPTLESLFGSLDFCECEECRSVLSPAAYLVDLLHFLDPAPNVWSSFLTLWQTTHAGQAYTATYQKPYDTLIARRPDLPNLPLTCENTTTALPYIDLVNEILEYFVAHGALSAATAYDTGSATTAELVAEPQHVLPAAYAALRLAVYPLALPFDLWLETVRAFFGHFGVTLADVLEVLRPTDDLLPQVGVAYGRAAVFSESLGLYPAETALVTAANPLTSWYLLYGYPDETTALGALPNAKTLSRRLGVTYDDLGALVQTMFVNPKLGALVTLHKLGVAVEDVLRYKGAAGYAPFSAAEQQAFDQRLNDLTASYAGSGFDARAWLDSTWNSNGFDGILVLADPGATCSFDQTALQYAGGGAAGALDFHRLNLFVRLWKRLGWTISEIDRALQVFLPRNDLPLTAAGLGGAMTTALLGISHLETLRTLLRLDPKGRSRLLTLWADLDTSGPSPLYGALFLTPAILNVDPVFDDPLGNYLAVTPPLQSHLPAVQAALQLGAADIERILNDVGSSTATATLSVSTLSLLERYALLSSSLRLSVTDLIALTTLSGLDPFAALPASEVTTLQQDVPYTQTLAFVQVAQAVRATTFSIEDLQYLLRQRFDPVGKYRPDPRAIPSLARAIASEIQRIQRDYAVPPDPTTLTDAVLQADLALVFPAEVVQTFLAMWDGTGTFAATQDGVAPASQLNPATFAAEPAIAVSYDAVTQRQQLRYTGVLLPAERARLEGAFPSPLVSTLLASIAAQVQAFFDTNVAGFATAADFATLVTPVPTSTPDAERIAVLRAKAKALVPFLQQKLIRMRIVQLMVTTFGTDQALMEALLTESALLSDQTMPGAPLLDAFKAAGERGTTAQFYASTDGTGPPLMTAGTGSTATIPGITTAGKPVGAQSARLEAFLEVPVAGPYRFFVTLGSGGARATLRIGTSPDPVVEGTAGAAGVELSGVITLAAGTLYHVSLDAGLLGTSDVSVSVQGETIPRGGMDQLPLYPGQAIDRISRAASLIKSALAVIRGFSLSETEVRYLLAHAADWDGLSLSALPTCPADDSPAGAQALFRQWSRLAAYTRLRADLAGGGDDLIDVFSRARRTFPAQTTAADATAQCLADLSAAIASLTRRAPEAVQGAIARLGFGATPTVSPTSVTVTVQQLSQEQGLSRLWTVLRIAERLGVSVDALARWASPEPDFTVASDLRDTAHAGYDTETWRLVAQPIFDSLRRKKRDALVASIVHTQGFERPEQLFEYFLVDPGMEPVVQTSRLRVAIAAVQLFVQRCLLSLEPSVHPVAINADQWQWMKRYRVWEANRKMYLWPENWLEPEFRDDQTNLFQDLQSALLQGDVSPDVVENAFVQYLKGLEDLARLDIVSLYLEERLDDPLANTLHVIGRTYHHPHTYYYRRMAHGMWSPWERVTPDIEGDHLVSVIWRGRLHLFWVTFMTKATGAADPNATIQSQGNSTPGGMKPPITVDLQLNWSEYYGGKWKPRATSGFSNSIQLAQATEFQPGSVFVHVSKEATTDGADGPLLINLTGQIAFAFRVVGRNSTPQGLTIPNMPQGLPYVTGIGNAPLIALTTQYAGQDSVRVDAVERTTSGWDSSTAVSIEPILETGTPFSLTVCGNPLQSVSPDVGPMISPFFYADAQNTFYVEPTLTIVTLQEWNDWIIDPPIKVAPPRGEGFWQSIPIAPALALPQEAPPGVPIDPRARFALRESRDWLTVSGAVLQYGSALIGRTGAVAASMTPVATGLGAVSPIGTATGPALDTPPFSRIVGTAGITGTMLRVMDSERPPTANVDVGIQNLATGPNVRA